MLPPPNDDFVMPEVSEEDFFNPKGDEDEALLSTGGWDNDRSDAIALAQQILDDLSSVRADADRWITVHPHNGKGTPALIGDDGTVKGGMGGKFNGQNIKDAHGTKKFTSGETNAETAARHKAESEPKANKSFPYGVEHPHELTEQEWNKRRENLKGKNVQSNLTKNSGSEMKRRHDELTWLIGNHGKAEREKLASATRGDIKISSQEAEDLLEKINEPITYESVKAAAEAKEEPNPQHSAANGGGDITPAYIDNTVGSMGTNAAHEYVKNNGEFEFGDKRGASRYAARLEHGEGGKWNVAHMPKRNTWRAIRESEANATMNSDSSDMALQLVKHPEGHYEWQRTPDTAPAPSPEKKVEPKRDAPKASSVPDSDGIELKREASTWGLFKNGERVGTYPSSLPKKDVLKAHADKLDADAKKKTTSRIKAAASAIVNAEIKKTHSALTSVMSEKKQLIDTAHHARNLDFHPMSAEEFNSKSSLSIHQSPKYGNKQGSEYRLVMVDGKPAYAREADHWGGFNTVDRGINAAPKMHEGDDYDAHEGTHTKSHNWTLGGEGQTNWGNKERKAGYVFLSDLENQNNQPARPPQKTESSSAVNVPEGHEKLRNAHPIERETDKAVAVRNKAYEDAKATAQYDVKELSPQEREILKAGSSLTWLPKSNVTTHNGHVVTMPRWLSERSGLETHEGYARNQARAENQNARFAEGVDRYTKLLEQAKAAGVKGVRVGMRASTIKDKMREHGLTVADSEGGDTLLSLARKIANQ